MDDVFKIIYRILITLKKAMDLEEFDKSAISCESLEISKPKWSRIIMMLCDSGYITGVEIWNSYESSYPQVCLTRPEITLKGLEYLEENSTMQRLYKAAKGVKEIIPGI